MVASTFNYFQRVDLTVKGYVDGTTTTKTYKFVSKALKDTDLDSDYWPILTNVGDITLSAGEYIPSSAFGGFSILNTIGSFGANRKFSDVLQRYDPTEQTVTVYVGQVSNDTNTVSSWSTVAVGVCSSWSSSINSLDADNTISFEVSGYRLPETVLTLEVNTSVSGMSTAPEGSIGRVVPLVISYAESGVTPIRITPDDTLPAKYAFATVQYQHIESDVASSSYIFVRDDSADEWSLINANHYDQSAQTVSGSHTLNTYKSQAVFVSGEVGLSYGIQLGARGNGTGGRVSTAVLSVFMLEFDSSLQDPVQVASTKVNLTNYDTSNNVGGGAEFWIRLGWEQPFIAKTGYSYAVGWSCTGYAANELSLAYYGAGVVGGFVRDSADSSGGFTWKYLTALPLKSKILGYTATSTTHVSAYTQTGLTYAYIQLAAGTAVDSGQVAPALNNLPILVAFIQGTTQYGTGFTTPKPHEVVSLLSWTWSGSSFSDSGLWDVTRYTNLYDDMYARDVTRPVRQRIVSGSFDSRVTYSQMLTEVCRASASRVGLLSSGKLFMYPWGKEQAATAAIPSADIIPESWERAGVETVINRIKINMEKDYGLFKNYLDNSINEGRTTFGYVHSNDFSAANMTTVADITAQSRALYGNREASEVNFELLAWAPTGAICGYLSNNIATQDGYGSCIAEYYLTRFGLPAVYATFIVPYHRYSILEMFDVISFSHPEFPAFYGTDPEARDPVYAGATDTYETNMIDGYEWVRAESYRGLIESKTYLMPVDHAPAIRLRVLVLLNPKDPT